MTTLLNHSSPIAIAMWDFSWLERRWPGAGYENWDTALDELVDRGYNAVRIDAYPHLTSVDARRTWTLLPCWNQQDWGSPAKNRVQVQPALNDFCRKCRDRGIAVGLSSWFQRDPEEHRLNMTDPETFGRAWVKTLDSIAEAGLLDTLLFVDLCNEWPLKVWAPFFNPEESFIWGDASSLEWIRTSIRVVRAAYPDLPYTYSYVGRLNEGKTVSDDLSFLDFLEPHVWMVHANHNEFYRKVDYNYERFDPSGYERVVDRAQSLYEEDPSYWNQLLMDLIDGMAEDARQTQKRLVTTECWSIVDYKDWPLLDWQWVKNSCEVGIRHAAATGCWQAMATSNFCGPQFVGMWRDVDWHQEMTSVIKSSSTSIA